MKFVKLGLILFFVCKSAFAETHQIEKTSKNSDFRKPPQAKSDFPEMEGQAKDLIAKIYTLLIPSGLKRVVSHQEKSK